jgi:hypothetical protein
MSEYQIVEYNETAAALAVLKNKYCTVFDVQTPKGLAAAREAPRRSQRLPGCAGKVTQGNQRTCFRAVALD